MEKWKHVIPYELYSYTSCANDYCEFNELCAIYDTINDVRTLVYGVMQ